MALLDFREIASANRAFNSRQALPVGSSSSVDDFELFAQEFFTSLKKMKIFKSVSNGPDQGIDLGVIDSFGIRWLVSCKHYAHMDKPVPIDKEMGVIEKTHSWDCKGFIAFYTTAPNSTLDQQLNGASNFGIKVERYIKDRIESELLASSIGTQMAARYFPKSMINHYSHLIKTVEEYHPDQVSVVAGIARLGSVIFPLSSEDPGYVGKIKERLAHDANISATLFQHRPYFLAAVKEAVQLEPSYFQSSNKVPAHFFQVAPTWDIFKLSHENSLEKIYFISAVWAFWNYHEANISFAKTMTVRHYRHLGDIHNEKCLFSVVAKKEFDERYENERRKGLLNISHLSEKLSETRRNILGRLFLFGQLGSSN